MTYLELPGVVLDGFVDTPAAPAFLVVNRDPNPTEAEVPLGEPVRFSLLATAVSAVVTLGATTVTIDGDLAFSGGVFQPGFSGSVVVAAANRVDYLIQRVAPFASDATVPVLLTGAASGGLTLSASWSFTTEDVTPPTVLAAVAMAWSVVRVAFSEPMQATDPSLPGDALNPGTWALSAGVAKPAWTPFVTPAVSAVRQVSATAFDVEFAEELSQGLAYRIRAISALDVYGNATVAPSDGADFVSARFGTPGRSFDLYRMLPEINRREDADGGLELRRFVACLQDVVDLLLVLVDRLQDQLDVDFASEAFVDAMLADLGNPFKFELDVRRKRLLLSILVQLYKQAGTAVGIVSAILFFLGVTVTIEDYTSDTLTLGESQLGVDWVLGPPPSFALYAFDVRSPVSLTTEQRSALIGLVQYLKPAHTHFARLLEPTAATVVDHWELGATELGTQSVLH